MKNYWKRVYFKLFDDTDYCYDYVGMFFPLLIGFVFVILGISFLFVAPPAGGFILIIFVPYFLYAIYDVFINKKLT